MITDKTKQKIDKWVASSDFCDNLVSIIADKLTLESNLFVDLIWNDNYNFNCCIIEYLSCSNITRKQCGFNPLNSYWKYVVDSIYEHNKINELRMKIKQKMKMNRINNDFK